MNYREEMDEGTVFLEPEYLDAAIIGRTFANGHEVLVYSFQGLAEAYAEHDDMAYEAACEWVEYNTLRALPYMGEQAPVVVYLSNPDGSAQIEI
jgi:hypothetical protein